jgi:hypothetical protein
MRRGKNMGHGAKRKDVKRKVQGGRGEAGRKFGVMSSEFGVTNQERHGAKSMAQREKAKP